MLAPFADIERDKRRLKRTVPEASVLSSLRGDGSAGVIGVSGISIGPPKPKPQNPAIERELENGIYGSRNDFRDQ